MKKTFFALLGAVFCVLALNMFYFNSNVNKTSEHYSINDIQQSKALKNLQEKYQQDSIARQIKQQKTAEILSAIDNDDLNVETLQVIENKYPDSLCKC